MSNKEIKTKIMGVVNTTPDSFYSDSRTPSLEGAIRRGVQLVEEGADILDIGGESSRPGSLPVSEEEELQRVIPVISALSQQFSIPISVDTTKPAVARAAICAGATWINDIEGFRNAQMQAIAVEHDVTICIMHMLGKPKTMQENPRYEKGVIDSLLHFFDERISYLLKLGVKDYQIVIDPGIGFGKTVADNIEIIQNLQTLKELGFPLLLGVSRKSYLGKILKKETKDLLAATLTTNFLALQAKVDLIRVHDVAAHRDMIDLLTYY